MDKVMSELRAAYGSTSSSSATPEGAVNVDGAPAIAATARAPIPEVNISGYMDDLTVTCPPHMAVDVANTLVNILSKWSSRQNPTKSKILCRGHVPLPPEGSPFQICDDSSSFVVLGSNMTSSYDEFNAKQTHRYEKFFECLTRVHLHPQVAFTIARLCGAPRLVYYASNTPPAHSAAVVAAFQSRLITFVLETLGFKCSPMFIHERFGLGLPDYVSNTATMFNNSQLLAIHSVKLPQVQLVRNSCSDCSFSQREPALAAHLEAQHMAQWIHFAPETYEDELKPFEFCTAMAIRCHTLPTSVQARFTTHCCGCGETAVGSQRHQQTIDHALKCTQSRVHFAVRHTAVKSALARVVREFGLSAQLEPNFYSYDGIHRQRPDLTVAGSSQVPIATDIVICHQTVTTGSHAAEWAAEKRKTHLRAVSNFGHAFEAFALETHGHFDKSCFNWIRHVQQGLPHFLQRHFHLRVMHAVSTALAKNRVAVILAMTQLSALAC